MKAVFLQDLTLVEMEERKARFEELNVEAVLNFAEYVHSNAAEPVGHDARPISSSGFRRSYSRKASLLPIGAY
jgi:hypothetical protein